MLINTLRLGNNRVTTPSDPEWFGAVWGPDVLRFDAQRLVDRRPGPCQRLNTTYTQYYPRAACTPNPIYTVGWGELANPNKLGVSLEFITCRSALLICV